MLFRKGSAQESNDEPRPTLDWPAGMARRSIEITVMNYCGVTTILIVSGFVVYRYLSHDLSGALVNAIIVLMLALTLLLGRVPGFRRRALIVFGFIISLSCLLSATLVSPNGLLWAYLVLWINFLVLPRHLAILCNLVIIVTLATHLALFSSPLHQISWATVAVLISGSGLVFTNRMREQRRMLSKLATLDPLTGAGNRRLMQHDLEQVTAEHKRSRRPAVLVVLDLDHFKNINDEFGHEAGDKVLERFVTMLRDALRTEDGLYRLGGEEFVVLLRNIEVETTAPSLNQLHGRLSGKVQCPGSPLHFSAGAAILREGENWSQWLARADQALYEAKRNGRNRLIIA